jgi:hypothetical protein
LGRVIRWLVKALVVWKDGPSYHVGGAYASPRLLLVLEAFEGGGWKKHPVNFSPRRLDVEVACCAPPPSMAVGQVSSPRATTTTGAAVVLTPFGDRSLHPRWNLTLKKGYLQD